MTEIFIPMGSVFVFMIVSFIEVIDTKNELIFAKTYHFDKNDYTSGIIAGVFIFVFFYGSVNYLVLYVESIPSMLSTETIYKDVFTWGKLFR